MFEDESTRVDIFVFFSTFCSAKGAIPALIISTLISFGIGSTVGMVPDVISDRFSRLHYHYDGPSCSHFDRAHKPDSCQLGADEAQAASAWAALFLNILTLMCNSVVGCSTDVQGRRPIVIASVFLFCLAPFSLVMILWIDSIGPALYYISYCLSGIVNYLSIIFASLSDTMPDEYRAGGYAVIMSGFYAGFALAPSFALFLSHFQVALLSFALTLAAMIVALLAFPETLPEDVAARNRIRLTEAEELETSGLQWIMKSASQPLYEIAILNRDEVIRFVAVGSFFSSMVFATDTNLLLYYIESELNVRDKDVAQMFFVMGILGVVMQAFLLQPLTQLLGEKGLLVTSFLSGTFHNFLYGIAKSKTTIYVALSFSQLTRTNFPLLSSFASKNASVDEQGKVQGALFALNALGAAIGPLCMQMVYSQTKHSRGPGTMFLFASGLYAMGALAVMRIPQKQSLTSISDNEPDSDVRDMEEPLLQDLDQRNLDQSIYSLIILLQAIVRSCKDILSCLRTKLAMADKSRGEI